jgi:hypothetical protein
MMKSILRALGALAVLLAAISASAQNSMKVTVPFEFAAAGLALPAGDYRVSLNSTNGVMTLRGYDLNSVTMLTAASTSVQDQKSVLRFYRDGSGWSLREVELNGTINTVPSGKNRKKQLVRRESQDEKASVEVPIQSADPHSSSEGKGN